MKKKIIKIIIRIVAIIISLILLFPIPMRYKDGGTIKFKAILYSITNYHAFRATEGYDTGIEIEILGITVYKNTTFDQR